ncbi:MAG TPA: glycosyltransferase family 2 protein [Verrucomicrobiota bacterium]|nr:glycosyltransferase family 2 protein [Verrucomicrobiota bacterium]
MSNLVASHPTISVVILNYNGQDWLERCFASLESQTVFGEIEVIVVDNHSPDGSAQLAERWLNRSGGKGRCIKSPVNLYFCEGNNVGAAQASGKYLFFLNNDTWLEPDCLETLLSEVQRVGATAANPVVLDYDADTFQSLGSPGFDLFGIPLGLGRFSETKPIFAACGCGYLIRNDVFASVGGFDPALLMYSDETDLSWRVQIGGGVVVGVPAARLHHRGATAANPEGKTRIVESRTSETKRFLSNRNGILLIAKNAQGLLLLLLIPHLLLLLAEAFASLVLIRNWRFTRRAYLDAIADAFRMRGHVMEWRRRIRGFRKRSDFQMLRFLRLRPARWDEVKRLFKFGAPKVDAR